MASCRSLEDEVVFHYQRHQNRCWEDLTGLFRCQCHVFQCSLFGTHPYRWLTCGFTPKEFIQFRNVLSSRVSPRPQRMMGFKGLSHEMAGNQTWILSNTQHDGSRPTQNYKVIKLEENDPSSFCSPCPPSNCPQSMSSFSGLVSAGYLLNKLATKARLSLGFPLTTSAGVTNCRQPSLSACCSMASALFMSSLSWTTHIPWPMVTHAPYSCYRGVKMLSYECQSAYAEACHADVYAWLIFVCAFRRDLIEEVEIGPWVLETVGDKISYIAENTVVIIH